MRDSDWVNKLHLLASQARALRDAINADADFLHSQGIMDYSLLLGVHKSKYRLVTNDSSYDSAPATPTPSVKLTLPASSTKPATEGSISLDLRGAAPITHRPRSAVNETLAALQSPLPTQRAMDPKSAWGLAGDNSQIDTASQPGNGNELLVSDSNQPADMVNEDEGLGGGVYHEDSGGSTPQPHSTGASIFTHHRGGLRAAVVEGPGVYYMGVIDILQKWTLKKRAENWLKTRILCQNLGGVSAVPPDMYADRFKSRVLGQLIED